MKTVTTMKVRKVTAAGAPRRLTAEDAVAYRKKINTKAKAVAQLKKSGVLTAKGKLAPHLRAG